MPCSDVEPMTVIEPAYSAWEAISSAERLFESACSGRRQRTQMPTAPAFSVRSAHAHGPVPVQLWFGSVRGTRGVPGVNSAGRGNPNPYPGNGDRSITNAVSSPNAKAEFIIDVNAKRAAPVFANSANPSQRILRIEIASSPGGTRRNADRRRRAPCPPLLEQTRERVGDLSGRRFEDVDLVTSVQRNQRDVRRDR